MWRAALLVCAEPAAASVQHACHSPPCARPDVAGRAMRSVSTMSLTMTALRPPSCGGQRCALSWWQIVCSKPATVCLALDRADPMRQQRYALC